MSVEVQYCKVAHKSGALGPEVEARITKPVMAKGGKLPNWSATAKDLAAQLLEARKTSEEIARARDRFARAREQSDRNLESAYEVTSRQQSVIQSHTAHFRTLRRHWSFILLPAAVKAHIRSFT